VSSKLDQLEAECEAATVLTNYAILDPPVCPFTIARKAGILVEPKPSAESGVSGFLMRVGEIFGIQYASHISNEGFVRFTVAHELGHYFLPGHAEHLFPYGDGVHKSRSGFISGERYERQADHFASALLMPELLFKREANRAGQGFPAIVKLAAMFKTSITATAIRYAKFTDDAVAVVVSSGNSVDYCFMSDRIADLQGITWMKKGDVLPGRSTTAAFSRDPSNVKEARQKEGTSYLDDWLDGAPAVEVNEDVIGLGNYGKTLTILFTDDDLEDDEACDDEQD
jgi:Zn-dependent peptidase ImmA (M78 family)